MLQTPDVTKAQIVAVVGALIGVLVAFGTPIDDEQRDSILTLTTVLSSVIVGADAWIRSQRAKYLSGRRPLE